LFEVQPVLRTAVSLKKSIFKIKHFKFMLI
jgi:hypothetical protein